MTNFHYRVRDPLGNTHHGSLEATSAEDAKQQLGRDGFQVLDLDDDSDLFIRFRRVSKTEMIFFTTQLAIMVDTGISLDAALDGIIEQEENSALKKILEGLKQSVVEGENFSDALAKYPKYFDRTYVSLVKASEASGTLGSMLERIADYLRKEAETRRKILGAMAYPMVMMVLALGVVVFLMTFILPKFLPMFKSKGTELPTPTKWMMTISDLVSNYWYAWVFILMAAVVGYVLARRTEPGRMLLDGVKLRLPILGTLFRKVTISRSIRTLGTMLQSGVPMLDSLRLCGEVSGNSLYQRLWENVRDEVTNGKRISEVLAGNSQLIPHVLSQMIASGEEAGKLDLVLERVSTYYDQEVDASIKTTTSLIEPMMITMMGFVVGGIGLAILLPIFSLSKQP